MTEQKLFNNCSAVDDVLFFRLQIAKKYLFLSSSLSQGVIGGYKRRDKGRTYFISLDYIKQYETYDGRKIGREEKLQMILRCSFSKSWLRCLWVFKYRRYIPLSTLLNTQVAHNEASSVYRNKGEHAL